MFAAKGQTRHAGLSKQQRWAKTAQDAGIWQHTAIIAFEKYCTNIPAAQ